MMNYYFPLNTKIETTEFVFLFESDTVIDRILNFDHNKGGFSFCGAKIPIWLMFLELLLSFYTKWKCLGHPGQDLPLDNFLQRAANKRYLSCRNKKNQNESWGITRRKRNWRGITLSGLFQRLIKGNLLWWYFSQERHNFSSKSLPQSYILSKELGIFCPTLSAPQKWTEI